MFLTLFYYSNPYLCLQCLLTRFYLIFSVWSYCTILGVTTNMVRQNSRLLVVCGPSGSGKSTLLRKLFDEYPDKFGFSVSHTTRSPRRFEVDGQHYHFNTKDQMQAAIDRGEFLEHAIFSNNMYGTR